MNSGARGWKPLQSCLAVVFGVTVALALAVPAGAHAGVESTDPEDDATLAEAPASVSVTFSETVDGPSTEVAVTGPDGTTLDLEAPVFAGETITQPMTYTAPGAYVLTYLMVSDDGHPIAGTFTFSVTVETEPPSADALITDTDPFVQTVLYVNRAAGYIGLALALGAGALLALGAPSRYFLARLIASGLALIAATAVVGILLQTAYETGTSFTAIQSAGLQAVMESNFGLAAILRILLVLLAIPLLRLVATRTEPVPGPVLAGFTALAAALAATWPLAGHPMAASSVPVAYAADWVHLLATLTWAGGVLVLLILAAKNDHDLPGQVARNWIVWSHGF